MSKVFVTCRAMIWGTLPASQSSVRLDVGKFLLCVFKRQLPHLSAIIIDVKIRSPDSESAACASRVEKPNPTGDDHKWRQ